MALDIASFVIEKLADPMLKEASLVCSVAVKVDSVKNQLEYIKSFFESVEIKGTEDKTVRLWVDQLREVSFRIEDAIDKFLIEVMGDRTTVTHRGCHFSFVRWIYKILMKPVALHHLGVELSGIEATLNEIDENRRRFNINNLGGSSSRDELFIKRRSLEYPDSEIIGLSNEKKAIVKKLLNPQAQNLHVISIVGTGGLGKTTLARKVFHSTEVRENFDVRIWLSISQEYNMINILRKMLKKIRQKPIEQKEKDEDVEYFVDQICSSLKKKKFLIVLDDVWSETFWRDIKMVCPPDDEMDRGRVLITTRNSNVARKAQSEFYKPQFLNQEQSKMLLYKVSFPMEKPPEDLDSAATEIAKKCRGLPLAIVVVGGRLYMERKQSEWRRVADSINWLRGDQECNKILATSYEDMPSVLKMCFMYLASFPEDYQIDAKSLIRTWVAESLVSDEVTAQNCLQELAQRCMIIVSKTAHNGSITKFWVHDLLLGLAINEAKEKKFMSVFTEQILDRDFNDARRASLKSSTFGKINNTCFKNERKVRRGYNKKLRSLLVFDGWLDVDKSLPNDLLAFRLLKVLKVHGCSISSKKLEKWCEELIHLRHLEFRNCIFETFEIPESIGHLKNLLTLDCTETIIQKLPKSLWSIASLRHVMLTDDGAAKANLARSAGLPNLRTLWNVELEPPSTGLDDWSGHISNLHELGLSNVDPWVVTLLKELNQLVTLKINNGFKAFPSEVLDMREFKFYLSLECLFLSIWPKHFELREHLLPPHLTKLSLTICFKKDPMPELEQLRNLEILILSYKSAFQDVRWVGDRYGDGIEDGDGKQTMTMTLTCSPGGFPTLRQLILKDLPAEEFTMTPGAMPMLEQLLMNDFHRMINIPELQHLKKLREFEWTSAPYFDEEIQAMREKNQHKLQHISSVTIRSHCFKLSILG